MLSRTLKASQGNVLLSERTDYSESKTARQDLRLTQGEGTREPLYPGTGVRRITVREVYKIFKTRDESVILFAQMSTRGRTTEDGES